MTPTDKLTLLIPVFPAFDGFQDGLNCDIGTDAHLMLVYDYIIMNMLERTEAR